MATMNEIFALVNSSDTEAGRGQRLLAEAFGQEKNVRWALARAGESRAFDMSVIWAITKAGWPAEPVSIDRPTPKVLVKKSSKPGLAGCFEDCLAWDRFDDHKEVKDLLQAATRKINAYEALTDEIHEVYNDAMDTGSPALPPQLHEWVVSTAREVAAIGCPYVEDIRYNELRDLAREELWYPWHDYKAVGDLLKNQDSRRASFLMRQKSKSFKYLTDPYFQD